MADRELLERIDEHMARGNDLVAQIRREFELNREQHELNRREHERNRAAIQDVRDSILSMVAAVRDSTDRTAASLNAMQAEIAGQRDQIQANTRAVLAMLDEFRGRGPGPSAAAG